jgi:hypothetical protein
MAETAQVGGVIERATVGKRNDVVHVGSGSQNSSFSAHAAERLTR